MWNNLIQIIIRVYNSIFYLLFYLWMRFFIFCGFYSIAKRGGLLFHKCLLTVYKLNFILNIFKQFFYFIYMFILIFIFSFFVYFFIIFIFEDYLLIKINMFVCNKALLLFYIYIYMFIIFNGSMFEYLLEPELQEESYEDDEYYKNDEAFLILEDFEEDELVDVGDLLEDFVNESELDYSYEFQLNYVDFGIGGEDRKCYHRKGKDFYNDVVVEDEALNNVYFFQNLYNDNVTSLKIYKAKTSEISIITDRTSLFFNQNNDFYHNFFLHNSYKLNLLNVFYHRLFYKNKSIKGAVLYDLRHLKSAAYNLDVYAFSKCLDNACVESNEKITGNFFLIYCSYFFVTLLKNQNQIKNLESFVMSYDFIYRILIDKEINIVKNWSTFITSLFLKRLIKIFIRSRYCLWSFNYIKKLKIYYLLNLWYLSKNSNKISMFQVFSRFGNFRRMSELSIFMNYYLLKQYQECLQGELIVHKDILSSNSYFFDLIKFLKLQDLDKNLTKFISKKNVYYLNLGFSNYKGYGLFKYPLLGQGFRLVLEQIVFFVFFLMHYLRHRIQIVIYDKFLVEIFLKSRFINKFQFLMTKDSFKDNLLDYWFYPFWNYKSYLSEVSRVYISKKSLFGLNFCRFVLKSCDFRIVRGLSNIQLKSEFYSLSLDLGSFIYRVSINSYFNSIFFKDVYTLNVTKVFVKNFLTVGINLGNIWTSNKNSTNSLENMIHSYFFNALELKQYQKKYLINDFDDFINEQYGGLFIMDEFFGLNYEGYEELWDYERLNLSYLLDFYSDIAKLYSQNVSLIANEYTFIPYLYVFSSCLYLWLQCKIYGLFKVFPNERNQYGIYHLVSALFDDEDILGTIVRFYYGIKHLNEEKEINVSRNRFLGTNFVGKDRRIFSFMNQVDTYEEDFKFRDSKKLYDNDSRNTPEEVEMVTHMYLPLNKQGKRFLLSKNTIERFNVNNWIHLLAIKSDFYATQRYGMDFYMKEIKNYNIYSYEWLRYGKLKRTLQLLNKTALNKYGINKSLTLKNLYTFLDLKNYQLLQKFYMNDSLKKLVYKDILDDNEAQEWHIIIKDLGKIIEDALQTEFSKLNQSYFGKKFAASKFTNFDITSQIAMDNEAIINIFADKIVKYKGALGRYEKRIDNYIQQNLRYGLFEVLGALSKNRYLTDNKVSGLKEGGFLNNLLKNYIQYRYSTRKDLLQSFNKIPLIIEWLYGFTSFQRQKLMEQTFIFPYLYKMLMEYELTMEGLRSNLDLIYKNPYKGLNSYNDWIFSNNNVKKQLNIIDVVKSLNQVEDLEAMLQFFYRPIYYRDQIKLYEDLFKMTKYIKQLRFFWNKRFCDYTLNSIDYERVDNVINRVDTKSEQEELELQYKWDSIYRPKFEETYGYLNDRLVDNIVSKYLDIETKQNIVLKVIKHSVRNPFFIENLNEKSLLNSLKNVYDVVVDNSKVNQHSLQNNYDDVYRYIKDLEMPFLRTVRTFYPTLLDFYMSSDKMHRDSIFLVEALQKEIDLKDIDLSNKVSNSYRRFRLSNYNRLLGEGLFNLGRRHIDMIQDERGYYRGFNGSSLFNLSGDAKEITYLREFEAQSNQYKWSDENLLVDEARALFYFNTYPWSYMLRRALGVKPDDGAKFYEGTLGLMLPSKAVSSRGKYYFGERVLDISSIDLYAEENLFPPDEYSVGAQFGYPFFRSIFYFFYRLYHFLVVSCIPIKFQKYFREVSKGNSLMRPLWMRDLNLINNNTLGGLDLSLNRVVVRKLFKKEFYEYTFLQWFDILYYKFLNWYFVKGDTRDLSLKNKVYNKYIVSTHNLYPFYKQLSLGYTFFFLLFVYLLVYYFLWLPFIYCFTIINGYNDGTFGRDLDSLFNEYLDLGETDDYTQEAWVQKELWDTDYRSVHTYPGLELNDFFLALYDFLNYDYTVVFEASFFFNLESHDLDYYASELHTITKLEKFLIDKRVFVFDGKNSYSLKTLNKMVRECSFRNYLRGLKNYDQGVLKEYFYLLSGMETPNIGSIFIKNDVAKKTYFEHNERFNPYIKILASLNILEEGLNLLGLVQESLLDTSLVTNLLYSELREFVSIYTSELLTYFPYGKEGYVMNQMYQSLFQYRAGELLLPSYLRFERIDIEINNFKDLRFLVNNYDDVLVRLNTYLLQNNKRTNGYGFLDDAVVSSFYKYGPNNPEGVMSYEMLLSFRYQFQNFLYEYLVNSFDYNINNYLLEKHVFESYYLHSFELLSIFDYLKYTYQDWLFLIENSKDWLMYLTMTQDLEVSCDQIPSRDKLYYKEYDFKNSLTDEELKEVKRGESSIYTEYLEGFTTISDQVSRGEEEFRNESALEAEKVNQLRAFSLKKSALSYYNKLRKDYIDSDVKLIYEESFKQRKGELYKFYDVVLIVPNMHEITIEEKFFPDKNNVLSKYFDKYSTIAFSNVMKQNVSTEFLKLSSKYIIRHNMFLSYYALQYLDIRFFYDSTKHMNIQKVVNFNLNNISSQQLQYYLYMVNYKKKNYYEMAQRNMIKRILWSEKERYNKKKSIILRLLFFGILFFVVSWTIFLYV